MLPTRGAAIWHLPDGDFTYTEFTFAPNDIEYDDGPGAPDPGMIAHGADVLSDSAGLVHDNERRRRTFHQRVARIVEPNQD